MRDSDRLQMTCSASSLLRSVQYMFCQTNPDLKYFILQSDNSTCTNQFFEECEAHLKRTCHHSCFLKYIFEQNLRYILGWRIGDEKECT